MRMNDTIPKPEKKTKNNNDNKRATKPTITSTKTIINIKKQQMLVCTYVNKIKRKDTPEPTKKKQSKAESQLNDQPSITSSINVKL